ncbi:MAG: ATP-binding protein, partial [Actinobacteria bacterium]|nr:ATP-binding protein [Actinomycetota bacterium]
VALVMTELVANAVMHARTEMILSVELEGDSVRVSVADGSHILPRWSPSSPTSLSGLSAPGAPGGYGPRRRRRRQGNRTPSPVGSVAGRSPS